MTDDVGVLEAQARLYIDVGISADEFTCGFRWVHRRKVKELVTPLILSCD